MQAFEELNKKLGLTPMSPLDMNSIHFESGSHSAVDKNGPKTDAKPSSSSESVLKQI